jgi:hypothetical protein
MTSLDDPITYAEELTLTREDPILEDESESSSSESEEEEEPRGRRPVATPDRRNRMEPRGRRNDGGLVRHGRRGLGTLMARGNEPDTPDRRNRMEPRGRRNDGGLVRHGRRNLGTLQDGMWNEDDGRVYYSPTPAKRPGCSPREHLDIMKRLYGEIEGEDDVAIRKIMSKNPNKVFCNSNTREILGCHMIINDEIVEPVLDPTEVDGETEHHLLVFSKDDGSVIHFDANRRYINETEEKVVVSDKIGMLTMPKHSRDIVMFTNTEFRHLEELKVVDYFPLYRGNGILSQIKSRSITTLRTNVFDTESLRFMHRNKVEVLYLLGGREIAKWNSDFGPGKQMRAPFYVTNRVVSSRKKLKLRELHTEFDQIDHLMKNIDASSISLLRVGSSSIRGGISTRFPNLKSLMMSSAGATVNLYKTSPHLFENLEHISIGSPDNSIDSLAKLIKKTKVRSLELHGFSRFWDNGRKVDEIKPLLEGIKELRISATLLNVEDLCSYYYEAFEGLETLILGGTKFHVKVKDQPSYRSILYRDVAIVPNLPVKNIVLDSFVPKNDVLPSDRVCIYDKDTPRIVYSRHQRMRHKSAKF